MSGSDTATARERVFLVVVDNSEELSVAVRYASLRARRTGGRVALLYVMERTDFSHWVAIDDLAHKEQREEAEGLLNDLSAKVTEWSGNVPMIYVREGRTRDELLKLIDEEPSISILVLAAGTNPKGPGPLVSHLAGKISGRLRIPVTVVPGGLGDDEIEALT